MKQDFKKLFSDIKACNWCSSYLLMAPKPVVQLHPYAKILVIAQAPGLRARKSGKPFDDASGDRLRSWLGIDRDCFYDERLFAFMPMGFCYPGSEKSGDLAPCKDCAPLWHPRIIAMLNDIQLTLLVGTFAQRYYLNEISVTTVVKKWRDYLPDYIVLPHPSWHNNAWIQNNPWFESELLVYLRRRIKDIVY